MKRVGIWLAFVLTVAANILWVYRAQLPPVEALWAPRMVVIRPVALPPDPQDDEPPYLGGWYGYDLTLPPGKPESLALARFELVQVVPGAKRDPVIATNDVLYHATDRLRIRFRLRPLEFDTVAALRKSYPRLPQPESSLCVLDLYVSGKTGAYSRQTHLVKLGPRVGRLSDYSVSGFDRRNRTRIFRPEEPIELHNFHFGGNGAGDPRPFALRVRLLPRDSYQPRNVFSGSTL